MTEPNSKPKAKRKAGNRTPATLPAPSLETVMSEPAPMNKSRHLEVTAPPGMSEDRALCDLVSHGMATNAATAMRFVRGEHGELSLTDMVASLRDQGEAVNRGDFAVSERMLNAQAVALNAIFAEMARRAALNMGEHLSATEAYMRLALKAQSQSRATFETLAAIKNPPVVFARQANISHGPQQVNNGAPQATASPRTLETQTEPNELLGVSNELCQDAGASQATSRANPRLESVGTLHRAANP